MVDLDRSRLTQERWFSLIRWLFIEAFLFHAYLTSDLSRVFDPPLGGLLIALAVYTLIVTLAVVFLRSWPIGLAYLTATVDTVLAVLFVAADPTGLMSAGVVGIAAASVGVGVRRFPIFETFAYSFIIAAGIVAIRFYYYHDFSADLPDVLIVGAVALLPVLARAVTLAPQEGARDDPTARLATRGPSALADISSHRSSPIEVYHAAANTLAQYSDSQFGAALVRNGDQSYELYSTVDGSSMASHLPAQADEQLPARLVAVEEPTTWTRRDNLLTRGLPDQYPLRLDSALVVPLPNASPYGAVLFAANRKGGAYRPDDRIFAALLAGEVARTLLAEQVAHRDTATRGAAMEALLAAVEAKRPGSREQAEECARLAVAVGRELGCDEPAVEELRVAALLHDVGELAIPDPILDKPQPLQSDEMEIVRQHPRVAARIIDYFNRSPGVLNAVYGHHERWDGRGYPAGLAGETIPFEARILCLADAIESMTSPRPYRTALSPADALQEVVKSSGTQFDPSMVQAFLAVLQREGPTFLERPGNQAVAVAPERARSRVG